MSLELITIAAGLVITWLLFTAIIKILKTSITTALTIAAILLLIQIIFGVRYQEVWQEFEELIKKFLVTIV
ncbi:MAG: hypothetical protein QNJ60_10175 [Xenococcaceae cyanobacterium MO_188.B19]|nr:hypothetical protein [Xenococcaceae cyanobacterium MO_188.B19]